ncbi:nucleotide sugar dehydrogenase [Halegenticoccus tardaugens]|uniref:nucleotide sugar dehydrogenase n=1 Tax=Halegenticoccus tardaugens TaxID=2071624 RepID=UPI001E2DD83C|nr:nucleotide sugar dehydrogenase [Halegenticoccus tardaugens]
MSVFRGVGLYGSEHSTQAQRIAFTDGSVPVAIYGLGKMGLPLAAVYAETTGNLTGVDIDESVVETINGGGCHINREPGLAELVEAQVERGALSATADAAAAADDASVHVIIVPTLVTDDKEVDLDALESVTETIARELDPGDTIIVECTVPPGTCRDRLLPIVEHESGLSVGDFGLAFCPERTTSGKALRKIRREHPKIVGGADDESTRVAELIYGEITENDVIPVSDVTTAEAVKVFEGLYRDVNIALANELARLADELDLDVNEAIDAANTQSFCDIHTPGAGVGGHCIPYYPYFLMQQVEDETPLVRTARTVNDSMPAFAVEKVTERLAEEGIAVDDAAILVLGVTYRPNVAETRATPAIPIIDRFRSLGADVFAADPLVDPAEFGATPADVDSLAEYDLDAAVLVTAHDEFDAIDWGSLDSMIVVDGRQALNLDETDHRVYTIGSGERRSRR